MEKWRGGLTTKSRPDVERVFNYMRNHYATYAEGDNVYYIAVYDQRYSPKPQDWGSSYTNADQALFAAFGPNGKDHVAFPAPSNAINSSYSRGGAPQWAFDNPQSTTDTAVIAQCALKIRSTADPNDKLITELLSKTTKAISAHTRASPEQGGIYWSFFDNSAMANYHVYCCF
jgi:hypothetical protein